MNQIDILLVDDHKLFRESMALLLNKDSRFRVIAQTGSGNEAVAIARNLKPHVVLMDINMTPLNGFEATKLIRKYCPGSKILAISMNSMPSYARQMIQIGGYGYLTKNSSWEEMTTAILEVYNGRKFFCEEIKSNLANNVLGQNGENTPDLNNLSKREFQIAKFVSGGYSSKEIAEKVNLSSRTVEVHRYNILKKLSLKNTASLVNFFNQQAV